jgi:multiple sugar transport system substrate-binding protein
MLGLGALAASALAAAACGAPAETGQPEAAVKPAGSIEFWEWGVTYVEGFNDLADEFNAKMDGARVVHTQLPGYDDKIKVTIAAGSGGPDVYLMRGPNHKQWAHDGLAIDLSEYANRDKTAAADLKTMQKTFFDYYHYEGKLHGLPWDFSAISVAYNVDALQARGLKAPAELGAKWDWNAFTEYAKQLTPRDGSTYGVDAVPSLETGYYNWVVANGGNVWSEDFKQSRVDEPAFVEAVDAYMSLANRLQVAPPRAWTTEQLKGLSHRAQMLTTGRVAMQTVGDWFFRWFEQAENFHWDVATVPYDPHTKKTGSIANFRGLTVAPTSQNRDLAWAWMSFLITRGVQDRIPSLMGEVPARLDSIDQVYLNPAKSPSPKSRKLLKTSIAATQALPGNPFLAWKDVSGALGGLNDVYDGKAETRPVLADIKSKLAALIG